MTLESLLWFGFQAAGAVAAGFVGWRVGGCDARAWRRTAIVATGIMLAWPLMRLFPAHVIRWLGAHFVMFIEVTGIVIPAVLLFTIAARNSRTSGQRRAVSLLIPVCCLYFVRYGLWMVRPGIDQLGPMYLEGQVCRQSTGYTCVAASLVTLLKAYGYEATETEMALLSHTEVNWGATDTRAVAALQDRLAGQPVEVCYEVMDFERLKSVPKPCVVPIRWNYFVSHMVPVLAADDNCVRVGDPMNGVDVQTAAEFQKTWQGRGIYLLDARHPARSTP